MPVSVLVTMQTHEARDEMYEVVKAAAEEEISVRHGFPFFEGCARLWAESEKVVGSNGRDGPSTYMCAFGGRQCWEKGEMDNIVNLESWKMVRVEEASRCVDECLWQ